MHVEFYETPGNGFSSRGAQDPPASGSTKPPGRAGQTPGQAAARGVVDRIDDTVEERCGCGCKRPLTPDGPSAYFASQDCQDKWYSARADNPRWADLARQAAATMAEAQIAADAARRSVLRRATWAAFTCLRCGARSNSPDDAREGYCRRCRTWTAGMWGAELQPPALPDGWWHNPHHVMRTLGYRRWCERCDAYTEPGSIDDPQIATFGDVDRPERGLSHGCTRCELPYPDRAVYSARLSNVRDGADAVVAFRFEVFNFAATSHLEVGVYELTRAEDPRAVADRTWQQVERNLPGARRQLADERARWLTENRLAALCVNPLDFIRRIGSGT